MTEKEVSEVQECINLTTKFIDDVLPQIGNIVLQDYAGLNRLCILLRKLKDYDTSED